MNPQFPIYIVSKGRFKTRFTSKCLEAMGVPYSIVVEEQEYKSYCDVIDKSKVIVLDKAYQRDYAPLVPLKDGESKGSGPARNFAWEHSVAAGHAWHWVFDDNIKYFLRLNRNEKIRAGDGTIFRCMEDFCLRYTNVAMAGPHYYTFAHRKVEHPPFILNTRIFSCILLRNDTGLRWRGRYNEDLDLSLRFLKAGWCTVQFYAFLQAKMHTLQMKGGNTDEVYSKGTLAKSQLIVDQHPDVSRLAWRFKRWHHMVDYSAFKDMRLIKRKGLKIKTGVDEYGMAITAAAGTSHDANASCRPGK